MIKKLKHKKLINNEGAADKKMNSIKNIPGVRNHEQGITTIKARNIVSVVFNIVTP